MQPNTYYVTNTIAPQNQQTNQSNDYSIVTILIAVFLFIIIVVLIIFLWRSCIKKDVKSDYTVISSNLPDDIKTYMNAHKDYIVISIEDDIIEQMKDLPKEIFNSENIKYTEILNHSAISWAQLTNIYQGILYRKRSSGSFSDKNKLARKESVLNESTKDTNNWHMNFNKYNMQEYTPGINICVFKGYVYSKSQYIKLFDDDEKYIISKVLISSDNPDYSICIIKEDNMYRPKHYLIVLNRNYTDYIILKTNAPELYIYENYSYKFYDAFIKHPLHQKVIDAKKAQDEYNKLDMNSVKDASYITKRFTIKPLFDKNTSATLFLNELNAIRAGLKNIIIKEPIVSESTKEIEKLLDENLPPIIEGPSERLIQKKQRMPDHSNIHIINTIPLGSEKKILLKSASTPILKHNNKPIQRIPVPIIIEDESEDENI